MTPTLVEAFNGHRVAGASAGNGVSVAMVWTDAGELYAFGGHYTCQFRHFHVPTLVDGLVGKKIVGASVGETHVVAWSDMGELYSFGSGGCGLLGHGNSAPKLVPTQVESLATQVVVGASIYRAVPHSSVD